MNKATRNTLLTEPPPLAKLPSVPTPLGVRKMREFMGYRPTRMEQRAARIASAELRRFSDYATVFGAYGPDPIAMADAFDVAERWRLYRGRVEALEAYVRVEDASAWKEALTYVKQLRPFFDSALLRQPKLADKYPGLALLFSAPKAVGKTASKTKAKKKKAKAKVAAAAAKAEATAAAKVAKAAPTRTVVVTTP
jgi:hypothetical protein